MTNFIGTTGVDTANATVPSVTGFTTGLAADLLDASNDFFQCNDGTDNVLAGGTNDTLHGDGGADILNGGAGIDTLNGGTGGDTLDGGAGDDTLVGLTGSDTFKFSGGDDVIMDFGSRYFFASLTGTQELPAVGTLAGGQVFLVLNRTQTSVTFGLSTSGLDWGDKTPATGDNVTATENDDVTAFHIHPGAVGAEGGAVWDIGADGNTVVGSASTGNVTSTWTTAEGLAAQLSALLSGGLYVNVHTSLNPDGEIRGQITEVPEGFADQIDLTALNIGSLATLQAITTDVAGSAKLATVANGVESTLTIAGVPESSFTAADFAFAGNVVQTLNGGALVDDLFGAGGNDTLNGLGGNDRLFGENDSDVLNGGAGLDILDGGAGNDTLKIGGSEGNGDTFRGGAGTDKIDVTGSSALTLASYSKSNSIETWTGNGKGVNGTSSANSFDFSALSSVSGLARIDGKSGNDTIIGSKVKETIIGGAGKDLLTGKAGNDIFDFNSKSETVKGSSRDQILDFKRGQDKIDVSTIDADTSSNSGNDKFAFIGTASFKGGGGELRCKGGIVQGDINGDKVADFEIKVNVSTLGSGDFLL